MPKLKKLGFVRRMIRAARSGEQIELQAAQPAYDDGVLTIGGAALEIKASADTEDDSDATYEGVAYDGGIINANFPHEGKRYQVVVDISKAEIQNNPQVALKDHDADKAVGHHTAYKSDDNTRMFVRDGKLAVPNAAQHEIVASARKGQPWQMSIRGPLRQPELLAHGEVVEVNGQQFTGPLVIERNFLWRETTFTGLGGNVGSPHASIAASEGEPATEEELDTTAKAELERLIAAGVQIADIAIEIPYAKSYLEGVLTGETTGVTEDFIEMLRDIKVPEKAAEPVAANAKTPALTPISVPAQELAASSPATGENPFAKQNRILKACKGNTEIAAKAWDGGWDAERIGLEVKLAESQEELKAAQAKIQDNHTSGLQTVSGGFVNRDYSDIGEVRELMATAMAVQAGVDPKILEATGTDQGFIDKALNHFAGLDFTRAQGHILKAHNQTVDPLLKAGEMNKLYGQVALKASGTGVGWSTLNIQTVTEDVCNKVLKARMRNFRSCVERLTRQSTNNDTKARHVYEVELYGDAKKHAKTTEIPHHTMTATKYTSKADLYTCMLTVPEECLLEDDLGIFDRVGEMMIELAMCSEARDFWRFILTQWPWIEGYNYIRGEKAVLCPAGLEAMEELLCDQRTMDLTVDMADGTEKVVEHGKPLDTDGVLMVANGKAQARKMNSLNVCPTVVPSASLKAQTDCNDYAGFADEICMTKWLKHPSLKDDQGRSLANKGMYLMFLNPEAHGSITRSRIAGYTTPVIETSPTAFNTLGTSFRLKWSRGFDQTCAEGPILMDPDSCLRADYYEEAAAESGKGAKTVITP